MNATTFEQKRLALFEHYGFKGESHRVPDREGKITYMIGRGEGPRPTVLIHGGISEASEFCLLANRIPGYVLIPDRPGYGLSYPIDYLKADYRQTVATWLLDLVDGIGVEQVDLVANSMGGFCSMVFAIAHPERVRRLVLVGAPAGLDKHIPLIIRLWGNRFIGQIIRRMPITDPETLRNRFFASILVAHPERLPLEFLELAIAAGLFPKFEKTTYTMLRAVLTLRGWRKNLMMRDELADLPVPTQFLWGEADKFAPPSSGEDMVARMPDAQIEVIPDAGHVAYLDQPEIVANGINRFLDQSN